MSRARRRLAIQLALALATLGVYGPVTGHGFVNYDDDLYVTDNEVVLEGLTPGGVVYAFTSTDAGNWNPLTWLSHMLDVELFGRDPAGHHATSVLLHLASSLLLFQFFERATGSPWRSAFVAAVFALHPLHVESVAWVAERKDVLSALLWMLTLCAYLGYCRRPGVARLAGVALAFAVGLLAKPMLVTLPCVLLLLDYWPLQRLRPGRPWPRVAEKLPLFALAAAASAVAVMAQRAQDTVAYLADAPLSLRVSNALVAYCAYVGMALWPANLSVFYPHPGELLGRWQVAAAGALLAAATAAVLRAAPRAPFLPVGWLWYLGTLVPVIGLIQVGAQGMADRYTYLPLVGLALIVAWGVPALLAGAPRGRAAAAVAALAALGAVTSLQLRHWRDSLALFEHALEATRRAWLPLPDSPVIHYNLGIAYADAGRPEEALREYRATLALGEENARLHNNIANALVLVGEAEESLRHYERALELDPGHLNARFNRGVVLLGLGRFEEAQQHYPVYLRERPEDAEARLRLARALAAAGRVDAAIESYEQALAIRPRLVAAAVGAATLEWAAGRKGSAIERLSRALEGAPEDPVLANNLAWMLATAPEARLRDPERAVRLAEGVRAGSPDDARALDTLAAAYAASGRFPDAVETARRALELAGRAGPADAPDGFRERLALYEQGRPYVESR